MITKWRVIHFLKTGKSYILSPQLSQTASPNATSLCRITNTLYPPLHVSHVFPLSSYRNIQPWEAGGFI
jgi:hypothetical protein